MIDFVKVSVLIDLNKKDSLLNRLNFKSEINVLTGELAEWPKRYNYFNLKFVLIPTGDRLGYWFEISGSLHRFWEGGTNYQPFNYSDLLYTIEFLSFVCQIAPSAFTIKQLEFGVNLMSLSMGTKEVLDNLIAYKGKVFTKMPTRRNKCIGANVELCDYRIKIYDKALQFNLPFSVCRVEVHIQQHTGHMVGINTLADLFDRSNIDHLGIELVKKTCQLVFDDPSLKMNQLRPSQQEFVNTGRNPREYEKFKSEKRERFSRLIRKHGTSQYADRLSMAVTNNWNILSSS